MRLTSLIVLAVALAIGIFARFQWLSALEMSADEGASWAAAAAPTVTEVIHLQEHLNPGKLPVHDLALHLWMRIFGDGLLSIRGLSATFGSIAIVLVFLVTREAFAAAAIAEANPEAIAAMSALLFAVNFQMIAHSREARMYMVMMAMLLAQLWFVLRADRRGRSWNYIGIGVFTALAVASHFTAALVVIAECIWLSPRLYRRWRLRDASHADHGWEIVGALALTALAMLPVARTAAGISYGFARAGNLGWISRPALTAPIDVLRYGAGSISAFTVCAVAALWGTVQALRFAPRMLALLVLWMFFPAASMLLISYAVLPVLVHHYALSSAVPFLILAALGIYQLPWRWASSLALVAVTIVCALPALPMLRGNRPVSMIEWSEAAAATAANLSPNEYAAVCPDWMVDVVRYYLRDDPQARVIAAKMRGLKVAESGPSIVMISDNAAIDDPEGAKFLRWVAPEIIARFQGVSVRRVSSARMAMVRRDNPSAR